MRLKALSLCFALIPLVFVVSVTGGEADSVVPIWPSAPPDWTSLDEEERDTS